MLLLSRSVILLSNNFSFLFAALHLTLRKIRLENEDCHAAGLITKKACPRKKLCAAGTCQAPEA